MEKYATRILNCLDVCTVNNVPKSAFSSIKVHLNGKSKLAFP